MNGLIDRSCFVRPSGSLIDAPDSHAQALIQLGFKCYSDALQSGLIRIMSAGRGTYAAAIGIQVFELTPEIINRIEDILYRVLAHPFSYVLIDWAIDRTSQPYGHLTFQNIQEAREEFKRKAAHILRENA